MLFHRSVQIKKNASFCGYEYNTCVKLPLVNVDYEGKSLEEIKNSYGDVCARHVYTMAVRHGVDLTKKIIPSMELQKETYVDIKFGLNSTYMGYSNWNLYLVSNGHSQSNRDMLVAHGKIITQGLSTEVMPYLFEQEIKKLFGDKLC
jgi:hypothetical protein